jgi:hypothetical protein
VGGLSRREEIGCRANFAVVWLLEESTTTMSITGRGACLLCLRRWMKKFGFDIYLTSEGSRPATSELSLLAPLKNRCRGFVFRVLGFSRVDTPPTFSYHQILRKEAKLYSRGIDMQGAWCAQGSSSSCTCMTLRRWTLLHFSTFRYEDSDWPQLKAGNKACRWEQRPGFPTLASIATTPASLARM